MLIFVPLLPGNLEARGLGSGNTQELQNCENKRLGGGKEICRDNDKSSKFTTNPTPRSGSVEALKNCQTKKVVGERVKCMDNFDKERAAKNAVINKVKNIDKMVRCKQKKVVGRVAVCIDKTKTTEAYKPQPNDKS